MAFLSDLKWTTGYCFAFRYYIVVDDKTNKLASMKKNHKQRALINSVLTVFQRRKAVPNFDCNLSI